MKTRIGLLCALLLLLAGCAPEEEAAPADTPPEATVMPPDSAEAVSLLGTALYARTPDSTLNANLAAARANYAQDPDEVDNIIWLGRRTAYLWHYREAIDIYSEGIAKHPNSPHLYRHRGHRYISIRDLDRAVADYERAAELIAGTEDEVEPDGQPNAAGRPTSTLHTNIWYHLGLAYYLRGEFDKALPAYQNCLAAAKNNDMHVATADWLYMTLRRLGREEEAAAVLDPITADMEILENHAYHRRLLMYKGEAQPEALLQVEEEGDSDLTFATQGYGVGNWYLYNGQPEKANEIFRRVIESGYWPAFGYIAAEAELKRME